MSLKRFTTYASSLLLAILVAVLIITPAIPVRASVTDFNGPSLPADWFATAWSRVVRPQARTALWRLMGRGPARSRSMGPA